MENFYELLNIMEEHDFSIEMLNQIKFLFQLGFYDESDFKRFSKLFYKKVKKSGVKLTDEMIKQILTVLYFRGVLNLEDVLFIDGACFDVQGKKPTAWNPKMKYISAYKIGFYGPSEKYRQTDFLETTFFFYNNIFNTKKLKPRVANILPQLREEINDIFVNFYNNMDFPKELGSSSAAMHSYAINCNEEEIINGLNNKTPFNVSVIARVEKEAEIIKIDIECDTSKEKFLTIKSIDSNFERLTDMIEDNRHPNKEKIKL